MLDTANDEKGFSMGFRRRVRRLGALWLESIAEGDNGGPRSREGRSEEERRLIQQAPAKSRFPPR